MAAVSELGAGRLGASLIARRWTRRRRVIPKSLFLLISALLLGGPTACRPPDPALAAPAVCELLAGPLAEKALDMPLGTPAVGQHIVGGPGRAALSSCRWQGLEAGAPTVDVRVQLWAWPERSEGAPAYLRAMRQAARHNRFVVRELPEIGDGALWDGTLHVILDRWSMSVSVRGSSRRLVGEGDLVLERNLAQALVWRLRGLPVWATLWTVD